MRFWVIGVVAAALCACGTVSAHDAIDRIPISDIAAKDPQADARDAVGRGDLRFVAVHGFTVEFPGLLPPAPREREPAYIIIEGTSDGVQSEVDRALNAAARAYAERYNAIISRARARGSDHAE